MTCPICVFPGNDPAAVRCTNCGFAMRPAPPNPEPEVIAAYDVDPIAAAPPPCPAGAEAAPGSRADPRAQAAALDAVLDASGASRTKLNDAIALVEDCATIEKAIGDLRDAGTERQSQLASVAAFDLSALPAGEQLRALLTEALNASLAADRSFVLWGQAVQGSGCDGGGGRDDHREAQRQSRLAGDGKSRFVAVWNPVAARHGLRERSATEI